MSVIENQPATKNIANTLREPLLSWAGQSTPYSREKSVVQLFEAVAAEHPARTAIIFGDLRLSYGELNRRGNRVAHALRRQGVGEDSLVGLCLDRSPELIEAIVGILKAGAAYVPIDAQYPRERIEFLLTDTQTPVLITQRSAAALLPEGHGVPLVFVEDLDSARSVDDENNPIRSAGPTSLAYVMYTSGSTGNPKGVLVENRSIVRLVCNTNYCHFGPDEVFLQLAPISFDASTFEIWGALLHGATLVIMPPKAASLAEIGEAIRRHQVTTIWLTAGLFHLMVDERLEDLRPLRQLLSGGDVLSARHVRRVLDTCPDMVLINGYGPTEGTTFTCCHQMKHGDAVPDSVPIGKPISNTFVYILDERLAAVRPGEPGEIFAGGDGVGRGYLNAPELSRERFLCDPFRDIPEARMYRTGDLGRWREDGVVEFLGRVDNQVKILGHRVEPGEIEAALLSHGSITQACVVSHTDDKGTKRLVAYYIPTAAAEAGGSCLKDFLAFKLPAYMIPSFFIPVSVLPLNPNGKVDRSALPDAFSKEVTLSVSGPQSHSNIPLEHTVTEIWKGVLNVPQLGREDNFFDLGGDSLLLVAVHSQLQKALHIEIEVTELFEFTTIRTLSEHLAKNGVAESSFQPAEDQARKQREAFVKQRAAKGSEL